MNNAEALAIADEIFNQPTPQPEPVRRARCKAGTRKRVCKVNGETVTDCFNPCSASAADSRKDDQIKKLKNDLNRKVDEIKLLNKRVNEKRNPEMTNLLITKKNDLQQKQAEIESIKKRANKTIKKLKDARGYDMNVLKRLKDEKNKLDLEVHECASKLENSQRVNQGLQNNNKDLMKLYKNQTQELEKCKEELKTCHEEGEECWQEVAKSRQDLYNCEQKLNKCKQELDQCHKLLGSDLGHSDDEVTPTQIRTPAQAKTNVKNATEQLRQKFGRKHG